ncbi:DUF6528 family protein [Paenibacillus sp. J2TS4]|uniref:DUF6528 family protein n=1 Tax=Paenibacillus sp. J2TS4 TaxID=2807194 RepID=UPI001AFD68C1|nr:DUF6528 family protein [Paenibacillus sp. J2TS4]GIP33516.1 hypothetical protein J2TS4_27260 [Paenibacillus sp. J2TS4]
MSQLRRGITQFSISVMLISLFLQLSPSSASAQGLTQVDGDDIVSGGYYVFAIPGISSTLLGSGQYAISSESNGNASPSLRNQIAFDETQSGVNEEIVWQAVPFGSGYSLKAYSKNGAAAYLNLNGGDLTLGEQQELNLIVNEDGTILISREIDGTFYYVRFTNTNGGGWQSSTYDAHKPSMSFRVFSITQNSIVLNDRISQIDGDEITSGGYYVFAISNIVSNWKGRGQYALSSDSNTNSTPLLRDHIKFDETVPQVHGRMVWQAVPFGSGYSLKAYSKNGAAAYLNLNGGDLTLGEQQELNLIVNEDGTILISREIDGTFYYARFTNTNGGGWQSSTYDAHKPSMSFRVFPVTENMIISIDKITEINGGEIVSGGFYSLSIPGINSSALGRGEYALASESNGNASPLLLRHIPFDVDQKSLSNALVWKIESFGGGYSLKVYPGNGVNSYLNLNGSSLTLGQRQELNLIVNEDGTVQISRNVDDISYYVRFTNTNGGGWQSSTDASYKPSMSFRVSAVPLTSVAEHPIKLVSPNEMQSGGYYIFAHPAIGSSDQGKGQFALSGIANINPSNSILRHVKFTESQDGLDNTIIWRYEAFGAGFSLKLLGAGETDSYLNLVINDSTARATLGPQQELNFTRNADGTAKISRTLNGADYFVRFTTTGGVGWHANTYDGSNAFRVFEVPGDRILPMPSLMKGQELLDGMKIVLAIRDISSNDQGKGQFALSSTPNAYTEQGLLQHVKFNGADQPPVNPSLVWVIEEYDGGYSLRADGVSGENNYLNISMVNNKASVGLGPRQKLTVTFNENGTVMISKVYLKQPFYIRFTNLKGIGWEAATPSNSASFQVYNVSYVPTPKPTYYKVGATSLVSGKDYVLAIPKITPVGGSIDQYAVSSENTAGASPLLLNYASFNASQSVIDYRLIWNIEQVEGGWTLRSVQATGDNKYLNIELDNDNQPSLTLGPKQTLTISANGSGLARVSRVIDGKTYYISFTTGNGQGWQANTSNSNNLFHVYEVEIDGTKLDVEEPREKPLFTITALTDLHVGYGLQDQPDVIREQTRLALEQIKTKENPDVIVVTGDISSTTGGDPWNAETYNKVVSQVTEAFAQTSKDGKVLYVGGDQDYEAGSTLYNSGAYMDATMLGSLGPYEDALYEGTDRNSNLLAYYYKIGGIHFIGINTPYNGDDTIDSNVYAPEAVDFLENKLSSIDNNDKIIVLGHYPLQGSQALSAPSQGLSDDNGMDTRINNLLLNYPNLIYIYGHDHGGPIIEQDTFERMTAYNADGSVEQERTVRSTGFVSGFAGSLSYSNNRFDQGPLSANQPAVVQSLMIYVYEDHVDLQMKNYGQQTGEKKNLMSYAIPFRQWITSDHYSIDRTAGTVTDIPHRITIENFLTGFDHPEELSVFGVDGIEITDYSRNLRSGMALKRMKGTVEQDSLEVLVNLQALTLQPFEGNPLVPNSADTEMIAVTDQVDNKIVVYKQDSLDWNNPDAVVWKWLPSEALGFTGITDYARVTDAKLRYSEFYGGYVVVTTASGGFVGLIDYETGERLYSRDTKNENNPHSIELLPDGNLVVADSVGKAVTIYASSQGDSNGYFYRVELPGAHGLVWDNKRKLIWAVGDYEVVAYEITGTLQQPTLTLREDLGADLPKPEDKEGAWGHDLFPVTDGGDLLWITGQYDVFQFNMVTGEVSTQFDAYDDVFALTAKSIGTQPYTGNIIRTVPNGTLASYNTNVVDIFRPDGEGGYTRDERTHNREAYYKARVWYPSIRMINDVNHPLEPSATLSGPGNVEENQSFDVVYGFNNMNGPVLAQDVTFNYDEQKLEFTGLESMKEGFTVIESVYGPGTIQLIMVDLGDNPSVSNSQLLKLQFKAKPLEESSETVIEVTNVRTSDEEGQETQLAGARYRVFIVKAVDESALEALIGDALAAVEGERVGQYPQGAKTILQSAINVAKAVVDNDKTRSASKIWHTSLDLY